MYTKYDTQLLNSVDISKILDYLGVEKESGDSYYCPNKNFHKNGDSTASLKINKQDNYCNCFACGKIAGDNIAVVQQILNVGFKEACQWIVDNFNLIGQAIPTYVVKKESIKQPEYVYFDKNIQYTEIILDNIKDNYINFNDYQKMIFIYTLVYRFSLRTLQFGKIEFYKKRGIDTKIVNNLGYLNQNDITLLEKVLVSYSTKDDLIKFKLFNEEGRWKYGYNNIVVPSFNLYSDTIEGFMLRRTYENKIKEINISCSNIEIPKPFGLTNKTLHFCDEFIITEGHCDGLAAWQGLNKNFISLAGVNGLHDEHLTLLKDKIIIIALDEDEAAEQVRKPLATKIQAFAKKVIVARWDRKYGKDLNDLLINNHLDKIVYFEL